MPAAARVEHFQPVVAAEPEQAVAGFEQGMHGRLRRVRGVPVVQEVLPGRAAVRVEVDQPVAFAAEPQAAVARRRKAAQREPREAGDVDRLQRKLPRIEFEQAGQGAEPERAVGAADDAGDVRQNRIESGRCQQAGHVAWRAVGIEPQQAAVVGADPQETGAVLRDRAHAAAGDRAMRRRLR